MKTASLTVSGEVGLKVTRERMRDLSLGEILRHGFPWFGQSAEVALWRTKNLPNLWRGMWRILIARAFGIPFFTGSLVLVRQTKSSRDYLGLASLRVVTTAGVAYIVDCLQGTVEPETLKYHGFGTGTTAEAVGDTALVTELTTQYAPDNVRPTGTQTEGATANIYRTSATISPEGGAVAITEHCVFTQAATGGGIALDRSKFAAVNVGPTDSLLAVYELTLSAGG